MRKKLTAFLGILVLFFGIFTVSGTTSYAASVKVSVSSASATVGSSVSVTVTVSGSGCSLGAAVMSVTYDASVLKFNSASGALGGSGGSGAVNFAWYADGDGTSSVSSTLSFTALAEGSSSISVTATDIVAWDETSPSVSKSGGSVKVSAASSNSSTGSSSGTAKETTAAETTAAETTAAYNEDLAVETDGKTLYVMEQFNADYVPAGFEVIEYDYKGNTVEAAKAKNADVILLRLVNPETVTGTWYIYDEDTDGFTKAVMINDTYTVVPLNDPSLVPEGFSETELQINIMTDKALSEEETDEITSSDVIQAWQAYYDTDEDFYLVYVVNPSGDLGFYRYDAAELTMQRYVREVLEEATEEVIETERETEPETEIIAESDEGFSVKDILLVALGCASAVLLIIAIVLGVKNAKKKALLEEQEEADEYDDYDEYEDEEEGEPLDYDETAGGEDEQYKNYDEAIEDITKTLEAGIASEVSSESAAADEAPAPDFNLPENMTGAKGFISELKQMEKKLLEGDDIDRHDE